MKSGLKLLSDPMVGWIRNRFGRGDTEEQYAAQTQSQVSKVIWDWPQDEPFRVEKALEKYPELRDDPRAVIEFAVEEFADRRDCGEAVSATTFARNFPGVQTDLLDSLVVDQGFRDNSDWIQDILSRKPDQYAWPAVGETVAGYKLLEPLGSGGFSRVYLADDPKVPDRKVALKLCRQETHEATSLANLNHRSIGVVYDVMRDDERRLGVISMQYRSRTTLYNIITKLWGGPRPDSAKAVWNEVREMNRLGGEAPDWSQVTYSDWVLDLAIELARGLAESHEYGIVHCDLKPANVLVDREGRPILVDFNVAFRRDAAASPGNVGGTLPYMAPEQIRAFAGRGYSEIGAATDLYGLGATIYELLTGRLPFGPVQSADDGVRALLSVRKSRPRSIRRRNSLVDIEFERLILDCMNYEIAERPQSAGELADALERIRTRKMVDSAEAGRRRATKWGSAAAIVSLAAVIGAGIVEEQPGPNNEIAPAPAEPTYEKELKAGFEFLNQEKWTKAADQFAEVLEQDKRNRVATIGLYRAKAQLRIAKGGAEAIESLVHGRFKPELASFVAYLRIHSGQDPQAIGWLRYVRTAGLNDEATLTNLAHALINQGKLKEAKAILEEVRQKFGDRVKANTMLVQVRQNLTSHEPGGGISLKDSLDLITACPRTAYRVQNESLAYEIAGVKVMKKDPDLHLQYCQKAAELLKEACRMGCDVRYWNALMARSPKAVQDANADFYNGPPTETPIWDSRVYTIDPLAGMTMEEVAELARDQVPEPILISGK